jgi:hypothetical protein
MSISPLQNLFFRTTQQRDAPQHTAWFRVRNNIPSIYWRNSTLDRCDYTLSLFKSLYEDKDLYSPPENVDVFLFADDIPTEDYYPCLAYSSSPNHDKTKLFSIPSFVMEIGVTNNLNLDSFAHKVLGELDIPFEDRQDTIFWIGGICEYRMRVANNIKNTLGSDLRFGYSRSNFVSLLDHNKYKYLLDMQGIGWSMRLMWLMWLGAVVFVLDRDLHEFWFRETFVPWVHYVPVKHDGSDLQENLAKVRNMPDQGKHIAIACRERAREILTLDYAKKRLSNVLNQHVQQYGCLEYI